MYKTYLIIGMALLLTACASNELSPPVVQQSPVEIALLESLARIDRALVKDVADGRKRPKDSAAKKGVNFKWSGSAIDLLKAMVLRQNYDYPGSQLKVITRGYPELPLPVSIDVRNASVDDIYALVAAQIASRADLILENDAIIIEYRVKAVQK